MPILIGGIVVVIVALVVAAILLLGGGGGPPADATPRVLTITRVITPTPLPAAEFPAPTLVNPVSGEQLAGDVRFEWEWGGAALGPDQAFELRIWSQAEADAGAEPRGAATPTKQTSADVRLDSLPTIQEHGAGPYYWSIVVIDTNAGNVVGEWGESRPFEYSP